MIGDVTLRAGDRVLITRLNYLGDVVLSLPVVDAIHRHVPGVDVDYLSRSPGAALLSGDGRFARVLALGDGVHEAVSVVRKLRARRYRAVVDLYSNPRSAWLTWLSGAPVRVGGRRRGRRHLYTHPITVAPAVRRVTDVFMNYLKPFGIEGPATLPALLLSDEERERARRTLAGIVPAGEGPRIGIHPGGKWPVKRWPAEKFAGLIERLRDRLGATPVLFTGPDERGATDHVQRLAGGGIAVVPPVPVRRVAALISGLDAMVACDGGIMHVAAAVGTPTVGIYGSAEPDVWFPYGADPRFCAAAIEVPCRPCHAHECPLGHTRCLNDLTPDAVARVVADVLSAGRAWRAS